MPTVIDASARYDSVSSHWCAGSTRVFGWLSDRAEMVSSTTASRAWPVFGRPLVSKASIRPGSAGYSFRGLVLRRRSDSVATGTAAMTC
jgi:hypothetical protein